MEDEEEKEKERLHLLTVMQTTQTLYDNLTCPPLESPAKDVRIERMMKSFSITDEDLTILHRVFHKYDRNRSGKLTVEDYFSLILQLPRTPLLESLLDLVGTTKNGEISFGEFVEITCTYAFFETNEIIRYCFFIIDRERAGYIYKAEIKHFIKTIWSEGLVPNNYGSNFKAAHAYLDEKDEDGLGQFVMRDIIEFHKLFPFIFYPAFRLQFEIERSSLGEQVWEVKKKIVKDLQNKEKKAIEDAEGKRMRALEEQKAKTEEENLRKRMGWKYYLMFWNRKRERAKMLKIAAITAQLDNEFGEAKNVET
jgi:Ca2+-binding EF-hand superfamily protein